MAKHTQSGYAAPASVNGERAAERQEFAEMKVTERTTLATQTPAEKLAAENDAIGGGPTSRATGQIPGHPTHMLC